MTRRTTLAPVAIGFLVALALARSAGAEPARQRFTFRHYGDEQGLGNLEVTALVQDSGGFLWVGTQDGLYRFDGQRFTRFGRDEGLPSGLVGAIYQTRDGTLWVGTDQGLARREGDRFRAWGPRAVAILGMAADTAGRLWIADTEGVRRLAGSRFEKAELPGWSAGRIASLCAAADGGIWLGGNGHVGHLVDGRLLVFGPEAGLPPERFEALLDDGKGTLWARSAAHLLFRRADARFVDATRGLPPSNSFGSLYLDRDGDLWAPTDFGLARRAADGSWEVVGQDRGLTSDAVLAVLQDREGLLWIGLAGTGLDCWLGYPSWTAYTTSEGLNNDAVWVVKRDATGALWVGTDKGLNRLDPLTGRWRAWGAPEGLGGDCAYDVLVAPSGELWIGLFPGGVSRFDPRRQRFDNYGRKDGLRGERVYSLAMTRDGALWVATGEGLFRARAPLDHPRFEPVELPGGIPTEGFWSLLADRSGRLWAAGERGLGVQEGESWRRLTTRDGLRADQVASTADAGGGGVWLAYWEPVGASRIELVGGRPRFDHVDRRLGLASDSVQALTVDPAGLTWIGTSRGLHLLESGRLRHYGRADGLIWENVNFVHADADGGLWIATSKGLAHYAPSASPVPPPSVVLLSVRLGDRPLPVDVPADVGHSDGTFEVAFAGLSFRKPEQVRCRYRLLGLEESPTETALHEARYPKLPPGRYAFEVECRNDEGTWSREPARFVFRIRPPWYRTAAALVAWCLLALLTVGLAYRLRVERLLRAQRRLEAAVAERTRELEERNRTVEEQSLALLAAAEERRRVYAMVVHDLKNPLTPLLGGLDFLEEGLRPDFRAGPQALQTMRQAARRMLFLIESYTSTLRATSQEGELQWRGFAALDLVSDLALSYAPATRKRGLLLFVNDVPVDDRWFPARGGALADAPAELVYRALENILGNALKYATSTIRLRVEEKDGRVGVVVENDGAPIPEADRDRIFGIYRQLDDARPGVGVGLASARRQVEEAGGEIRVADAAHGSGVRFEVWLRRIEAPEA